MVNCRPIRLPDRFDLTRDANGVDNKHPGRGGAGLSGFNYPNKTLTHPGTVIGAVQTLARPLKRATLILDPRELLSDEIAGSDYVRAIPVLQ